MKDIKEIYVDGVETIHLLNGTVRLDMFSLQPPQEGEKPAPHTFERVIMPIQSFLNMHTTMQQIVEKLLQDGIITSNTEPKNNWEIQK